MATPQPGLIPGTYLSDKNLAAILGICRSLVWVMTKRGELPPPVRLTAKTTRWSSDSVIEKLNRVA